MSENVPMQRIIEEVYKFPCIWNMDHMRYSDRHVRLTAWRTVCRVFFPLTEENSLDERRKIALLQKKWKSLRDYYMKLRRSMQIDPMFRAKRRKYIYYDKLQFLEGIVERRTTDHPDQENLQFMEGTNGNQKLTNFSSEETALSQEPLDLKPEVIEEETTSYEGTFKNIRQNLDEDELFLLSLLPSIRKLTPLQKMDFKLETMETLKKLLFET